MRRLTLLILIVFLLTGCSTVSSKSRPASYYDNYERASESLVDASLFSGDAAVLSDDQIRKILDYKYVFPQQNRIAILPLERYSVGRWYDWSAEFTQLNEDIEGKFINKLASSDRVYDASYLPVLLIPKDRSVPRLREAAARYQADLILVYRTNCRTYGKSRFFKPDLAKSYCSVEAVLVDTRTGIVPFTSVSVQNYTTPEGKEDLNKDDTRRRAELVAIQQCLSTVADELVSFINRDAR
jgi:uncharacterized protein YceK